MKRHLATGFLDFGGARGALARIAMTGAMAGAMAGACTAGCLYTDRIIGVEEEHLSPSVKLGLTLPLLDDPIIVDSENPPAVLEFNINAIEDPNVDDVLRVRWFIDGGTTLQLSEAFIEPTGVAVRLIENREASIDLSVASFGLPTGVHRVEAIISDGGFANDATPADMSLNRVPAMFANAHYVYWQVEFR